MWKKVRNRAGRLGYILIDAEIIKEVNDLVITNPKNNYDQFIQKTWKRYQHELVTHFGIRAIQNGIQKVEFDSWWKKIVKRMLIWNE